MTVNDDRTFRTREFAQLAGVTPRALRYYDRIGLLKPKRTRAGYRAYSARDVERLEQIVALKFLGIPLKKIGLLITRTPKELARALHAQRRLLEDKRRLFDQAITALEEAEQALRGGQTPDATLYRRIIEVIEMQDNSDAWKKKYEDLVQAKADRLKSLSPEALADLRSEWTRLLDEIRPVVAEDPAGARAQELATKWVALLGRLMGKPIDASMTGYVAAYPANSAWAPSESDKPVWDFIHRALAARG
jgi:MerR family transcriptional regulator, thiopeptide resistance regulator